MKKSHIILLFFIAICIGVFAAKLGNVSSYSNYDDAQAKEGEEVHITGTLLKDKPIEFDPVKDANSFSFYIRDNAGKEFKVICLDKDGKPQHFEKSDQVVLTGVMNDGVFYASDLLVKCPSKYVDKEVEKE